MAPHGTVLFINKSAKSKTLTRSEGAERKGIYSHVQQLPDLKTSKKKQGVDWAITTIVPHDALTEKTTDYSSRRDIDQDSSRRRRKKTKNSSKAKPDQESEWPISRLLHQISLSIISLKAFHLDPFNCSPVPIDTRISEILKEFCASVTNRIYTVKSWAHISLQQVLTCASQCPELLYATLYSTSTEIYARSGCQRYGYHAIYFKGLAISHLQRTIDDGFGARRASIATMRAVFALCYQDCIKGDFTTARQHYIALQTMVNATSTANFNTTPLAMRTSLVIPGLFTAALLNLPPLSIPITQGGSKAYTTELLTRFDLNILSTSLPSRFQNPATESLLGPELCSIISRMHEIEGFSPTPSTQPDVQVLFANSISLAHTLQPPLSHSETPEQTAIRIALYLSHTPLNASNAITTIFKAHIRAQLLSSLKQTDLERLWFPSCDLLLWVLCISAWAFDDEEGWMWVAGYVGRVVRALGIESLGELEELLRGFVFVKRYFGDGVGRLWERIQET